MKIACYLFITLLIAGAISLASLNSDHIKVDENGIYQAQSDQFRPGSCMHCDPHKGY